MAKPNSKNGVRSNGHASPKRRKNVDLFAELEKLRARFAARGGRFLNRRELEREIAERRGL